MPTWLQIIQTITTLMPQITAEIQTLLLSVNSIPPSPTQVQNLQNLLGLHTALANQANYMVSMYGAQHP